ncbi:hypothetical protein [Dongshaea marina]|uniref:hypothetical protein n=1 Tax=Dongshaea marina TaxID=2047966 RepID=UPI000D3E307C|nr:hypothetical protein [Dongshaea marina]
MATSENNPDLSKMSISDIIKLLTNAYGSGDMEQVKLAQHELVERGALSPNDIIGVKKPKNIEKDSEKLEKLLAKVEAMLEKK